MTDPRLPAFAKMLAGQVARKVTFKSSSGHPEADAGEPVNLDEANVVTSLRKPSYHGSQHSLLLDLDVPAYLVDSSTPGHTHLYVDVSIPHAEWTKLMMALAKAGVIESGYAYASIARKASYLRVPWKKKGEPEAVESSPVWPVLSTQHLNASNPKGKPLETGTQLHIEGHTVELVSPTSSGEFWLVKVLAEAEEPTGVS